MGDLKGLPCDRFSVLHSERVMPADNRGILRFISSHRLIGWIQKVVTEPSIVRLKERAGLGKTLVIVAQERA